MKRFAFFLVVAGLAVGASASAQGRRPAPPPPPPSPFPMSAENFRARVDKIVNTLRTTCNRIDHCPKEYVESGINQMKVRTLDACRDGVVTKQEAEYVFAATPTIPLPPPPPPSPGPHPPDDD